MKQIIFTILLLSQLSQIKAQTIDETFKGQWAMTSWTFEFKKDGTFNRTSSGHFGNPTFTGDYKLNVDTIIILNGYEESSGTLNPKYLIENDSTIIDLTNFYDYSSTAKNWGHISKKRYDILPKPNMDSIIRINSDDFYNRVKTSLELLRTKRLIGLSDQNNIEIIRITNTLWMSQDSSYKKGIYKEFTDEISKTNYEKEISTFYDWIPNRGMGFYFQKLQVELGGTPHLWSRYVIKEE